MVEKRVDVWLRARDEVTKTIDNLAKNSLPGLVKSIGAAAGAHLSASAAIAAFKHSIEGAIESEAAERRLAATVRDAGQSVGQMVPRLLEQAKALSLVMRGSDEAIEGVQQILISIGGLGGAPLDRATVAVLKFAAGTGRALPEAADAVAKAANGATREFNRLGVDFAGATTSGEKLERVLAFIEAKFGSAAIADVEGLGGAIHQLSKSIDELEEALGKVATSSGAAGVVSDFTARVNALAIALERGEGLRTFFAMWNGFIKGQALLDTFDRSKTIGDLFGIDKLNKDMEEYAAAVKRAELAEAAAKAEAAEWVKKVQELAGKFATPLPMKDFNARPPLFPSKESERITMAPSFEEEGARAKIEAQGHALSVLSGQYDTFAKAAAAVVQVQNDLADAGRRWTAQIDAQAVSVLDIAHQIEVIDHAMSALGITMKEDDSPEIWVAKIKEATTAAIIAVHEEGAQRVAAAQLAGDSTLDIEERTSDAVIRLREREARILGMIAKKRADSQSNLDRQMFDASIQIGEAVFHKNKGMMVALGTAQAIAASIAAYKNATDDGAPWYAAAIIAAAVLASQMQQVRKIEKQELAAGGFVRGYGNLDTVPAMLTPGEYVVTKSDASAIMAGRAAIVPMGSKGQGATADAAETWHANQPQTVNQFVIYAMDGADVMRVLRRHPEAVVAGLDEAQSRGMI